MQYESSITSSLKVMAKVSFSKVGQVKVTRSKLWYYVKGLIIRNTHMQYESCFSSGLKVIANCTYISANSAMNPAIIRMPLSCIEN